MNEKKKRGEEEVEEDKEERDDGDNGLVLLDDGLAPFCLNQLESDPLLDDLKNWDYPIFDLLDRYGQRILSAVIYSFTT